MASLDKAQILHVAKLASLSLSDAEAQAMTSELARIVAYVEKLGELDTADVPPTTSLSGDGGLRPDVERPSLTHDEALANAPHAVDEGFAVPRFVDAYKAGR